MSLQKLYDAVTYTAEKAYQQKGTQDVLNMAAATLQMAQAYQMMKECEIHENFHVEHPGNLLPGEGPLSGGGAN